ncbi:hypothetical protein BSQ40_00965 [Serratia fonticola]|nr:hypothetical protein BSQ40_00965 [Serratia fonticola]
MERVNRLLNGFLADWAALGITGNRRHQFTWQITDFFTFYRFYVICVVDKIPSNCCTVLDTHFVSYIHVKGKFDV